MTLLQQVHGWVSTYPGMERLTGFWVDDTGTAALSGGIFPLGLTEAERREDILGNVEVLNEYRFQLQYVLEKTAEDHAGAEANGTWLLGFQDWVQEESAWGNAPPFGGEETYGKSVKAEQGKLSRDNGDGTATYSVVLTIKYKKGYEV